MNIYACAFYYGGIDKDDTARVIDAHTYIDKQTKMRDKNNFVDYTICPESSDPFFIVTY